MNCPARVCSCEENAQFLKKSRSLCLLWALTVSNRKLNRVIKTLVSEAYILDSVTVRSSLVLPLDSIENLTRLTAKRVATIFLLQLAW